MQILLKYIDYYINIYNENLDFREKILIMQSIKSIFVLSNNLYNNDYNYINVITKKYSDFICDKQDIEKETDNFSNVLIESNIIRDEDILYIFEIINKINKYPIINVKDIHDKKMLSKYIGDDYTYHYLIEFMKDKTIYSKYFPTSCVVNLYKNNLLVLNNRSVIDYIHEITHVYTSCINNIYIETPSIMMELGLESFYRLGDKHDRIQNLNYLRQGLLNIVLNNKQNFQEELKYLIGTIIGLSFIYMNGSNFKNIKLGVDTLCYNSNSTILDMLRILNISEANIVDAFKNKEKILCK